MNIQQKIDKKEQRRSELFALKEPIDEELEKLYDEIESLRGALTKQKLKEEMTFEEKCVYFLEENGVGSDMVKYRAAEKFFQSLGLNTSGYFPEVNQKCIQFHIDTEENNLAQVKQSLLTLIPFVKTLKTGEKYFKLMEHTLSEFGSYSLVYEDNEWRLEKMAWGRKSVVKSFTDLHSALLYIQQYHPYNSPDEE